MSNAVTLAMCSALALLALPLAAQDDRPNLSGTWQFDSSKSELHTARAAATWVINENDSSIDITESEEGASKKIEMKCTVDGKVCKVAGLKATTSFWYNGPMLVEMETKGDHVTRYRMKLSGDGKTLTVDTTSIVPQDPQDDVLVFRKQA
jgi:predicted secreted protein